MVTGRRFVWLDFDETIAMRVQTKRIYDAPSRTDGWRVLVDRLWPRGIRKDDAKLDDWAKPVAPSDELRKWFGHDPDKWKEFRRRYRRELDDNADEVAAMLDRCRKKTITLLFAAKDREHNNAVVLKERIEAKTA